jgi:hypothetical protein
VHPAAARLLLPLAGLVVLATVVAGTVIRQRTGGLGTATPPFVMSYLPDAKLPWFALAVVLAAAAAWAAPRLARPGLTLPTPVWLGLLALLVLLPGLALGAARKRAAGLAGDLPAHRGGSFEAKNEYLPGLPALSYGARFFLDRFAELVPSLPVNVAGHPPALMLLIDALGLTTPGRLAALCIAAAVVTPLLSYALARALGQPRPRARVAGVLAALSPLLLLFGITSADAVFMAGGAATAVLLVAQQPALRVMAVSRWRPPRSSPGRCWRSAPGRRSWSWCARGGGGRSWSRRAAARRCWPSTARWRCSRATTRSGR